MKTVNVNLKDRSYPIYIGHNVLEKVGFYAKKFFNESNKIVIVTNPKVGKYYLEKCKKSFVEEGFETLVIIVPDGEKYKNLDTAKKIYTKLLRFKTDRHAVMVALGGGVIGDLVGFVAATYLRGIPLIQVPTTLLSQVDSSVGGKVAVNLPEGKNLVGAFYQPKMVFIDCSVLTTLHIREVRCGIAEVIKYGIIKNRKFFNYLDKNIEKIVKLEKEHIQEVVAVSCRTKANVVENDETEKGERAILNFGHTIGHALEAITKYKKYRHGEAVAIGMVGAMIIAEEMSLVKDKDVELVKNLIERSGLPVKIKVKASINDIVKRMEIDKKVTLKTIRFVLTKKIGCVSLNSITDKGLLRSTVKKLF